MFIKQDKGVSTPGTYRPVLQDILITRYRAISSDSERYRQISLDITRCRSISSYQDILKHWSVGPGVLILGLLTDTNSIGLKNS